MPKEPRSKEYSSLEVQFDDYQCGVWVCWWAATLLDWLASGQFLNLSLDGLVFTNATTGAQIQRNAAVVQEAREHYEKRLSDASAKGTLVYTAENKMTNGSTPTAGKKPKVREPMMRGSSMNERRKEPSKLVTRGVKTRKSVHWGECVVSGVRVISKSTREQICGVKGVDNYYEFGKARAEKKRAKRKAKEAKRKAKEALEWESRTLTREDLKYLD